MSIQASPKKRRILVIPILVGLALLASGCFQTTSTEPAASTPDTTGQTDEPAGQSEPIAEIDIPVNGQGSVSQFRNGLFLTLTAVPEPGWRFAGWSGTLTGDQSPVVITPSERTSISARFVATDAPETDPFAQSDSAGMADADADGVADENDTCANTPAGASVNPAGCAASQRDTDADGVTDDVDECIETPSGSSDVNAAGCAPTQRDTDLDKVPDDLDECEDTPMGLIVLPNGCALSQMDSDSDGITDDVDRCPSTATDAVVDATGCVPAPIVAVGVGSDDCAVPINVIDGVTAFNNFGATTDGPTEAAPCEAVGADIWFCYTASCTGDVLVSLCDSEYDTVMTVYDGCGCPTASPAGCDDDACGVSGGSRLTFAAINGASYMLRIGGFDGEEGNGKLAITCGGASAPVCGNNVIEGTEQCDPPNGTTCDTNCQNIAGSVCGNGNVEAGEDCDPPDGTTCDANCQTIVAGGPCGAGSGSCFAGNGTPGCDDVTCCETICDVLPLCCSDGWDFTCAFAAEFGCGGGFGSCGPGAGDCRSANGTPGCDDSDCCNVLCIIDPICCTDGWDDICAESAVSLFADTGGAICGP